MKTRGIRDSARDLRQQPAPPGRGDSAVAAQTPRPRRRGVGRQTTAAKSSMDQSPNDKRSVVGGEKAAGSECETTGGPVGDLRRAETEWSFRLASRDLGVVNQRDHLLIASQTRSI